MKAVLVGCTLLFLSSIAWAQPPPQQTEDQKRLMDRHKKTMLVLGEKADEIETNLPGFKTLSPSEVTELGNSAVYLLKCRAGIPFVEDRLIDLRKRKMTGNWTSILRIYSTVVAVEDIPDKMIPEFVALLERDKNAKTPNMYYASEFGTRGKAFLPVLEWIRDNSLNEETIRSVKYVITLIKN